MSAEKARLQRKAMKLYRMCCLPVDVYKMVFEKKTDLEIYEAMEEACKRKLRQIKELKEECK